MSDVKCLRCGGGIHNKIVIRGIKTSSCEWSHDDYKKAWKVDEKGYAHNLHFAVPDGVS